MSLQNDSVFAHIAGLKAANPDSIAKLTQGLQTQVVEKYKERERETQRSAALARTWLVR